MMNLYIIGIFSHHDGDNKLFKSAGRSEQEAIKEAIMEHCEPKYRDNQYREWVDGLGDNYEEIATNAAQGELIVSKPIKL